MRIFRKCFCEYICDIIGCVYVEVVHYLSSMRISTVVIANIELLSSSLDDSGGNTTKSTLIVIVDWQQW